MLNYSGYSAQTLTDTTSAPTLVGAKERSDGYGSKSRGDLAFRGRCGDEQRLMGFLRVRLRIGSQ